MKKVDSLLITTLKVIGRVIPGTYLKTFLYLNLILAPRKLLRKIVNGFYRMDHIYEVIREFKNNYKGNFSILEFGVADGYSFTKKLYAVRYLKMEDRIRVHGFDTFEGLPDKTSQADHSLVTGGGWSEGHFKGRYENLLSYCQTKYRNFQLHKGTFDQTITDEFLETLRQHPPMLIWVDCDYYSSTRDIFDKLIAFIPTGCVIYFDDIYFNFSSRFTGEMKAVWEINQGLFGQGVELVLDTELSWDSNRIYRCINTRQQTAFERIATDEKDPVRLRQDDSPLP